MPIHTRDNTFTYMYHLYIDAKYIEEIITVQVLLYALNAFAYLLRLIEPGWGEPIHCFVYPVIGTTFVWSQYSAPRLNGQRFLALQAGWPIKRISPLKGDVVRMEHIFIHKLTIVSVILNVMAVQQVAHCCTCMY